jgi:hypothetical protein
MPAPDGKPDIRVDSRGTKEDTMDSNERCEHIRVLANYANTQMANQYNVGEGHALARIHQAIRQIYLLTLGQCPETRTMPDALTRNQTILRDYLGGE